MAPPTLDPTLPFREGTLNLVVPESLGLYIHLPWCVRKCPYCDFNSHEAPAGVAAQTDYLDALLADLDLALPMIWGRRVATVFIGGGTPSLFEPAVLAQLLSDVRARVALDPGCEITLEANPGTFERDRFRAFREIGITRLSVGVQSFDDGKLSALGRIHSGHQARLAVEEARAVFERFNIDLMYGLPGQSLEEFRRDLDIALALQAPHLSIYHLSIEPNTRFAVEPPKDLPHEDLCADMLDEAVRRCADEGLQRYEVSAYAQPTQACKHNLNYWHFGDYLGIGAGAHSKLSFPHRVLRQVRWREPARYMHEASAGRAVSQEQVVTRDDLPFEFMLNALRLHEGFRRGLYSERTGLPLSTIDATLTEAEARGLLIVDERHIRPTARGFDFLSDLQSMFLPRGKAAAPRTPL